MAKIKKYKDFDGDNLSDDIIILAKNDKGELEKIKEPVNILQITGLVTDKEELKILDENFTLDTSLVVKNIKRGDTLWLTAILERSKGQVIDSQKLGVIQVRIVDYFYGLNKLNQISAYKK